MPYQVFDYQGISQWGNQVHITEGNSFPLLATRNRIARVNVAGSKTAQATPGGLPVHSPAFAAVMNQPHLPSWNGTAFTQEWIVYYRTVWTGNNDLAEERFVADLRDVASGALVFRSLDAVIPGGFSTATPHQAIASWPIPGGGIGIITSNTIVVEFTTSGNLVPVLTYTGPVLVSTLSVNRLTGAGFDASDPTKVLAFALDKRVFVYDTVLRAWSVERTYPSTFPSPSIDYTIGPGTYVIGVHKTTTRLLLIAATAILPRASTVRALSDSLPGSIPNPLPPGYNPPAASLPVFRWIATNNGITYISPVAARWKCIVYASASNSTTIDTVADINANGATCFSHPIMFNNQLVWMFGHRLLRLNGGTTELRQVHQRNRVRDQNRIRQGPHNTWQ